MSTNNFHNVNASSIYAFECEEEFDYQDMIDNIKCELENKFPDFYPDCGSDPEELRSYPSNVLGDITVLKAYRDFDVEIKITAICRSGYYSGANLDWSPIIMIGGYEIDNWCYLRDAIEDIVCYSDKKLDQYEGWIKKWAEIALKDLSEGIEEIYEQYTIPLVKVAQFSNGEAIYEKRTDSLKQKVKAAIAY